ncbi:hypothetical protein OH786_18345 [Streptomyces atratus]|uniref:hypothetical protein n=1 Tax=Streptomyces atratus TaxID=1893 RepID=UPI001160F91A|nr:hypothetical protein [Streptomyces atratus]
MSYRGRAHPRYDASRVTDSADEERRLFVGDRSVRASGADQHARRPVAGVTPPELFGLDTGPAACGGLYVDQVPGKSAVGQCADKSQ